VPRASAAFCSRLITAKIGSSPGTLAASKISTAATDAVATERPASTVRRDGLVVLGESACDMIDAFMLQVRAGPVMQTLVRLALF
jgi:hypothetical protein